MQDPYLYFVSSRVAHWQRQSNGKRVTLWRWARIDSGTPAHPRILWLLPRLLLHPLSSTLSLRPEIHSSLVPSADATIIHSTRQYNVAFAALFRTRSLY